MRFSYILNNKVAISLDCDPLELMMPVSKIIPSIPGVEEIQSVIAALLQHDRKMAIVLLGSRALKKAKPYSDWDLGVVRYPDPVTGMEFIRLKNKIEEITEDLVREVDLVNLNQAPSWFLSELHDKFLFLDGNQKSYIYLKGLLDGQEKAA